MRYWQSVLMGISKATQEPIEGALVVASFVVLSGSHDSAAGLSIGLEVLTGKDGRAHFPAWSTTGPGYGGNEPLLVAYKISYMSVNSSTKSVRERSGSIFHVTDERVDWFGGMTNAG